MAWRAFAVNTHGMGASDAPGAGRCIITAWAHQMRRSEPECARPLSSPSSLPPHGSTRPGLACVWEEEEEGPLLLLLPASSSAAIFGTLDDMELEQTGFVNGNKKPFVPENPLLFILTSVP